MAEHDTVVGMSGHAGLPGPGRDPVPYTVGATEQIHPLPGDPDATSKRYFIEVESPELDDIVERLDDEDG